MHTSCETSFFMQIPKVPEHHDQELLQRVKSIVSVIELCEELCCLIEYVKKH